MVDRAMDDGQSDLLDTDLAAIEDSFGVLDAESSLDRADGARGAHLERIKGR